MDGKGLRQWRTHMGWSQEQAGKAFGKTRRAYQELEATAHEIDRNISAHALLMRAVRDELQPIPDFIRDPVETTIAEIDAMPKPGRPKKDLLEELHTLVKKHRRQIEMSAATVIGGADVMKGVREIYGVVDAIDEAAAIEKNAKDAFDNILE